MTAFCRTRVVSRSFMIDMLQGIRHALGWRLRGYEDAINRASSELVAELEAEYDIEWFRLDVDGGSASTITVYGEGELL